MQKQKKVNKRSNNRRAGKSRSRKGANSQNANWITFSNKQERRFDRVNKNLLQRGFASTAPIAVSDDLQQYVHFERGSKDSNLIVSCCIPFYQICSNSFTTSLVTGGLSRDGTTNFASVGLGSLGGTITSGGLDVDTGYLSPVLKLQGTSFVRYGVRKCQFIYEPQSPTTGTDRMVFAYANDPNHPNVNPTDSSPTQASLLALSDSVAFAPWRSWSLDVSKSVNQNLLYTFEESTLSLENRFTFFGAIGCVPSNQPLVATPVTVYGILYACIVIEFREFCPLVEDFTPSTFSLIKRKGYKKPCSDPECKACQKKCIKTLTPKEKDLSKDKSEKL